MKLRKFRIVALMLVFVLLFSGCEPFLPPVTNIDPFLGHEIIPYEEIQYTRPNVDEIKGVFERGFNAIGEFCADAWDTSVGSLKRMWEGFVSVLPDWMYKSDGKSDCAHIDENGNGV